MKLIKLILLTLIVAIVTPSYAQCTGCTTTISTSTTDNFTVEIGELLCITSTGTVYGNITMNGGAICNQGVIKSGNFSINNGIIDNYGSIVYAGRLELKNESQLFNYNGGNIEIGQNFIVAPSAFYVAGPRAKLKVAHFETIPLVAYAGDNQTICNAASTLLGGPSAAKYGMPPYTYTWAPSTGLNSTNVSSPTAKPTSNTTYTLTVTDAYGARKSSTVTVNVLASPTANAGSPQTVCKGATVNLGGSPSASGGASPYKYIWTRDDGLNNDSIANPTATPTRSITYVLSVVDNNSCYSTSSVVITVKPVLSVFAGNDTTIIKTDTARLGGNPTVYGTAPFTYSWSPTTALNSSTIANPKATPTSNTTYVLTVTDAGSCGSKKDTVVVSVDVNQKIYAGADVKICLNDTATLGGTPTSKGGTTPYTYSWSPSTGLTSSSIANPKAFPTSTTSYVLTVTDAASHVKKDTVVVTVKPKPNANAGSDITLTGPKYTLGGTPAATGGTPPYKYSWVPSTGMAFNDVPNPYIEITDTVLYKLTVTDSNNCKGTDDVLIRYNEVRGSICSTDSCTWVVDGYTTTNYTVGSGQKLCINAGGVVRGTVTLNSGGTICNAGKFTPTTFTFNGGSLRNNATGTGIVSGNVTVPSSSVLANDGNFTITGYFQTNNGSTFSNSKTLQVQGKMYVKTANFYNGGVITLNTSSLIITSPAVLTDEGTIRSIDSLKNSATLQIGDNARIFTKHFYNYSGAVTKKITSGSSTYGGIMVCSRTENYGSINDSVDICDKSPSAGPVFLDVNSGTVQSSVRYCKGSLILADSSEVCGNCAALTLDHDGCVGDFILFTSVSTKKFDAYEFFRNGISVQKGPVNTYQLTTPAITGDTIVVVGIATHSPCTNRSSAPYAIPAKPSISISGPTSTADSVTLTASGATTYRWQTSDGVDVGTGASIVLKPTATTTYVVYGKNSSTGCEGMASQQVKKTLKLTPIVKAPDYFAPTSGNINLNISGGKLPFTYAWSDGSTGATLISPVPNTTYSVTITDADAQTATLSIPVGNAVPWVNSRGVSSSGTTITKLAVTNAWGDAEALSGTTIDPGQNGWVEFTVQANTDTYSFGLGTAASNGQYTGINYAYLIGSGGGSIVENGVTKTTFSGSNIPVAGDVLRVERVGSTINYKRNGTLITSSSTSSSLTLKSSVAIYTSGASISGIQGGFTQYAASNYLNIVTAENSVLTMCNGDLKKNFISTISYDENGSVISETKLYKDFLGRPTQTQERVISDNNVLVQQIIYDTYGRSVLQTLQAPVYQSDICYKDNFITNKNGKNYSNSDFNIPNYTANPNYPSLGEVDNPYYVNSTTPNSLGWYYGSYNTDEPYVPATAYPYTRVEYDDNNYGPVKRQAQAGNGLQMGSTHESQNYSVPSLNELDYLYGKNKFWIVQDYNEGTYDGQGTITPSICPSNVRLIKNIEIDENGLETVSFTDFAGNVILTCLSGQVNGTNVLTKQVTGVFTAATFGDVHLPKGCESSLVLNNGGRYNILDMKKNIFMKFSGSVDFTGTTPNLPAGIYRIIPMSGQTLSVTQNVNYYKFNLSYYDKAGNVKLTVPPEGVDLSYVPNSGGTPAHKMINSVEYNSFGWTTTGVSPDQGVIMTIYNINGQPRFFQNDEQRNSHSDPKYRKFSYINYDDAGREIEAGEYDPTLGSGANAYFDKLLPGTTVTPDANFTALSSPAIVDYVGSHPVFTGRTSQQAYTIYDIAANAPLSYLQRHLMGRVSKTWNAEHATWYSYDEQDRIESVVKQITNMPATNSNTVKTINYKYDIDGNVTEVAYQKEDSNDDFYHYYEYDADKRLKRVSTSFDAGVTKSEQAYYTYYKHDALKRAELGNKTQGLDYVYTINGWLKCINSPEFVGDLDPGKDGVGGGSNHSPKDYFGITLDYFAGDYSRAATKIQTYDTPEDYTYPPGTPAVLMSKNLYNGMIKGQRWQTKVPDPAIWASAVTYPNLQLMSGYLYDNDYQITSSIFGTITSPGSLNNFIPPGTHPPIQPFTYKGPVVSSSLDYKTWGITYDGNGNLKNLNRNGFASGSAGLDMDQLTYNYFYTTGPRLLSNRLKNITDAKSSSGANSYADFGYRSGQIGSMTNYMYNANGAQIGDLNNNQYNTYDMYGRVTAVYANDDLTGLLVKYTYDENGNRIKKTDGTSDTWYIIDEDGEEVATYVKTGSTLSQKEVMVTGDKRLGFYDYSQGTYIYELADQLGNVRSTYSIINNASIDTYFDKAYKDDYLFGYNSAIDYTVNHFTSPSGKIASVKTNTQQPYGTGLRLSVIKDQHISGSFYFKTSGTAAIDAMLVIAIEDPITHQLLSWTPFALLVGNAPYWSQATFSNFPMPATGIASIYFWNNDPTQTVWMDDLSLSFGDGGGPIIPVAVSMADYYPHGSLMPGRNYQPNSYRFGYQGQFAEKDPEINKVSFELRQWSGLTGRWSAADPANQYASSYNGMRNNPVNMIDPNGGYSTANVLAWQGWKNIATGAIFGAAAGGLGAVLFEKDWKKVPFWVGGGALAGALTGAILTPNSLTTILDLPAELFPRNKIIRFHHWMARPFTVKVPQIERDKINIKNGVAKYRIKHDFNFSRIIDPAGSDKTVNGQSVSTDEFLKTWKHRGDRVTITFKNRSDPFNSVAVWYIFKARLNKTFYWPKKIGRSRR